MKSSLLLQLASVAAAFVLPDQDVLATVQPSEARSSKARKIPSFSQLIDLVDHKVDHFSCEVNHKCNNYAHKAHYALDEAISSTTEVYDSTTQDITDTYFDAKAWIDHKNEEITNPLGAPTDHAFGSETSEEHGGHGHMKGNQTVYQLISESKYSTKLKQLVDDYPDLVEALNSTEGHFTIFAPTDRAFEKIPEHAPKPSKELLKKILEYHISPKYYPAGRVLVTRTIPTLLKSDDLAKEPTPQRLATEVGLRGLTVNFYSRIVAINIFGSNGVIHGIDTLLIPPPPVLKIVDLVPEEFSTLELGLFKTGLFQTINASAHTGGTLFAPTNFAFQRLGARANAFLFSPPGLKYLKPLLEYHVVANQTLYSDHYTDGRSSEEEAINAERPRRGPPRGYKHFDLETTLEGKSLAVDVSRYGRLIDVKINGYSHVTLPDGVAKDGVVHGISKVLIPPHKHHHDGDDDDSASEMSVDELVERLEPLVTSEPIPEEL